MERRDVVAAILLAILTLPFHPHWLDFEAARRGIAMALTGGGLLLLAATRRACPMPWAPGSIVLAAFVCWSAGRTLADTNMGAAWLRVGYLVALYATFVWGSTRSPRQLAVAIAPTLIAVATFGLAQALGLEWPSGYARTEPVSTLGNRNVASEFVSVGAAAMLAALAANGRIVAPWLAGLLLSAAYAGCNASRSGLVAISIVGVAATLLALRTRSARTAAVPLAAIAVLWIAWLGYDGHDDTADPTATAAATETRIESRPSTLAVRRAIWESGIDMVAERPLAGHGTASFRFAYPRYRSDAEIELSSFGRRFATFVATAHNDPLEIAIEEGVIGLGLWIAFWLTAGLGAVRRAGGAALPWLLPGVALLALGMVRSPWTNAPAALVAIACTAAAAHASTTPSETTHRAPRLLVGLVALALLCAGVTQTGAQFAFAGAVHPAEGVGRATLDAEALEVAIALDPTEPRLRSARIRAAHAEAGATPSAAVARTAADRDALRSLDPDNPTARYLLAETAHFAGRHAEAEAELDRVLAIDPRHIEATLLRASRFALAGRPDRTVAALYHDPAPRLRAVLADQLAALARSLESREPETARALAGESRFVRAVDALTAESRPDEGVLPPAGDPSAVRADRNRVLYAADALLRDGVDAAARWAPSDRALDLNSGVRRLLDPLLENLGDRVPAWRTALARPANE